MRFFILVAFFVKFPSAKVAKIHSICKSTEIQKQNFHLSKRHNGFLTVRKIWPIVGYR